MTLNERYSDQTNKQKRYNWKIVLASIVTFGYMFTLARHTSSWSVSSSEKASKWNSPVNVVEVSDWNDEIEEDTEEVTEVGEENVELAQGEDE